jgi:hypothetical protein
MNVLKLSFTMILLCLLLATCQASTASVQPESPSAYPPGGDAPVSQEPAYPAPVDKPVRQNVIPYPASGQEPLGNYTDPSYLPQTADASLTAGNAYPDLQSSELLVLESYPVQINLVLRGELPTPCHQLRIQLTSPDAQNRIEVRVYSVVDPDQMCIQVLDPFEATVSLGSFPSGTYVVLVNGEYLGEFDG